MVVSLNCLWLLVRNENKNTSLARGCGGQSIYCCKDLCHFSAQILPHLEPSVSSDIIFCKIHTSEASRARYNGMRKTVDFGVSQKKCVQIPPVSLDSHQTISSLVKQWFISLLHSGIT